MVPIIMVFGALFILLVSFIISALTQVKNDPMEKYRDMDG